MTQAILYRWRLTGAEADFIGAWTACETAIAKPGGVARLHRADGEQMIAYALRPAGTLAGLYSSGSSFEAGGFEKLEIPGDFLAEETLSVVDDQIAEPAKDPIRGSAALYRWRAKAGREEPFVRGWSRGTAAIHELCQSYGARLHRAERNEWVSYARWPDEETRTRCFKEHDFHDRGFTEMRDATAEFLSEEPLEILKAVG